MGCLNFPLWIGITTGTVVVVVIIVIVVMNRKWEAVKFLLFMRFNVVVKDDEPEDVDNLEFDAFVSFRYGITNFPFVSLLITSKHTPCALFFAAI